MISYINSRSSEVFWSPFPCWVGSLAKRTNMLKTTTVDGRNQATVTSSGWWFIEGLPHYLQHFIHPRWLFGISSINSITKSVTRFGIQFKEPGILTHPPFRSEAPFPSLRPRMETPLHLAIGLGLLFQHVDLARFPWEWDKVNGLHTEWKMWQS